MVKSFIYKLIISVCAFVIILSSVYFMCGARNAVEEISLQSMARKNSEYVSRESGLSLITEKADSSVMRTEPRPIEEADLRAFCIGGEEYVFPCTVAELADISDINLLGSNYDEKRNVYTGRIFIYRNGIRILTADYECPDKDMSPDKCLVTHISAVLGGYTEGYTPQIVIAGMDIHNTSPEEMLRLTCLDKAGYVFNKNVYFHIDGSRSGYVSLDITSGYSTKIAMSTLDFIPDSDKEGIEKLMRGDFRLLTDEIRLPEDYSPEKYPMLRPEEYPEIIYDDENITPDIAEYGISAYELMAQAGIECLEIYSDWQAEGMGSFRVICCHPDDSKYARIFLLLTDGQQLGEAAVFYAPDSLLGGGGSE